MIHRTACRAQRGTGYKDQSDEITVNARLRELMGDDQEKTRDEELMENPGVRRSSQNKELIRLLKISPVLIFYVIWVQAIYQTSGIIAELVALPWFVFLLSGKPDGVILQIGLFLFFGIFLPYMIVVVTS